MMGKTFESKDLPKVQAMEAHNTIESMHDISQEDKEKIHTVIEGLGFKYIKPRVPKMGEIWKTEDGVIVLMINMIGSSPVNLISGERMRNCNIREWTFEAKNAEEYYANKK